MKRIGALVSLVFMLGCKGGDSKAATAAPVAFCETGDLESCTKTKEECERGSAACSPVTKAWIVRYTEVSKNIQSQRITSDPNCASARKYMESVPEMFTFLSCDPLNGEPEKGSASVARSAAPPKSDEDPKITAALASFAALVDPYCACTADCDKFIVDRAAALRDLSQAQTTALLALPRMKELSKRWEDCGAKVPH